ncbi:LOW QUALITY PROTEIN: hypothetical protein NC653_032022 [Populus alba x Populus x berolinensis]|uniref:26S proteasome regulatory subunit Rpn7 N-terminal domain-containing protein n=1 Tax=Populus alba x Populus x berolinensis TaxID=444605 RepID=A0AAD6LQJ4_9ROSI|nr:LOW QUALITY PROTEIN: hypothetical protein NC653_032022 [Populus alba x Populus x berolinensis]
MEPDDEIHANGGADVSNNRNRPIISSEQLDIEAYAGLYTGRTKITRLLFIADRCGQNNNTAMKMEALRMAYEEIKKGENTQLDVVQKIDGRLGSNYGMDSAWCEMVDRRADQRKEKLENELNAYRTNLIKESIRMGYNDFGDLLLCSWLPCKLCPVLVIIALHQSIVYSYVHGVQFLVSIEMGQFTHVHKLCSAKQNKKQQKLLNLLQSQNYVVLLDWLNLEAKKYKTRCSRSFILMNQARSFVLISNICVSWMGLHLEATLYSYFAHVIFLWGTVLGSKSLNWEIHTMKSLLLKMLQHTEDFVLLQTIPNFRNFLVLEVGTESLESSISDFYSSHYASRPGLPWENLKSKTLCLTSISLIWTMSRTLYDQIRNTAHHSLYTQPFVSVDLHMMCQCLSKQSICPRCLGLGNIPWLESWHTPWGFDWVSFQKFSVYPLVVFMSHSKTFPPFCTHLSLYLTDKNIMPLQARIDSKTKILYARHAGSKGSRLSSGYCRQAMSLIGMFEQCC